MISTPYIPKPDYSLVYEPAEDSFLFLDLFEELHTQHYFNSLSNQKTPLVLEIGSGSGVISTFIATNRIIPNSIYLATDINPNSVEKTYETFKHNSNTSTNIPPFDIIQCNLTDPIINNSIDILIFNPPYVPSEDIPDIPVHDDNLNNNWLDLALVGGTDGMLVTYNLLDKLNSILNLNGEAYILFCARNNHTQVVINFKQKYPNFSVVCVINRKCGWEELAIYRFKKLF